MVANQQPFGAEGPLGDSEDQAMTETDWNPWKMTTFSLLLVGATALVTTLVMGYRADREDVKQNRAASRANASVRKTSLPSQIDVEKCQAYALRRTGDRTTDMVKDGAIGGVVGAGAGAAGGAVADGGSGGGEGAARHDAQYQASYCSCMRQNGY
jgi:hypothetical protein